jgi:arsenate reductase-like glutaredoxin family protein
MKEVKIIVYSFDELSEDAKQKAIEDNRDINFDFKWWDHIYCDAKSVGLKIESFDLDRNKHAIGVFILEPLEVAQNIINEHGESCETYKTAKEFLNAHNSLFSDYLDEDKETYESKELEQEMSDLEDDFLNSLCFDYANILQREYEYLCSDKAIIETIQANEYNFLKCGA